MHLKSLLGVVVLLVIYTSAKDVKIDRDPKLPNIVFILTDDQDTELGGLTPMTKTKKLLKEEGMEFVNMFATTPLCCPSRTSILTGLYQHNHETLNNSIDGNCSSKPWQQNLEKQTLGTFAKSLKYSTFFAGKYLNQYGKKTVGGPEHVPPGWDNWFGLGGHNPHIIHRSQVGNSRYYNYTLSDNGNPVSHGDKYAEDYLTDLIANKSTEFIKKSSYNFPQNPFLMMISTPAPHSPWNSAPQYQNQYANNTAPKTKNYNVKGKSQHWLLRQAVVPMTKTSVEYSDNAFRSRWRTLLSVDDLVEKVVNTLNDSGVLDNTYVIFSSDNGYHLGQFGLPIDKRQLYEFDIRVPLIVRGPGVPKNVTRTEPVLNIDLTPTMLDIANGSLGNYPESMDGKSFAVLLKGDKSNTAKWREDFLVEYQGEGSIVPKHCPPKGFGVSQCFPDCVCEDAYNNTYSCIRTLAKDDSNIADIMYCEFTDTETFVEIYNLTNDPYQLDNIRDSVNPDLLVKMNTRLIELGDCSAKSCRTSGRYSTLKWVEEHQRVMMNRKRKQPKTITVKQKEFRETSRYNDKYFQIFQNL